MRLDEHFTDYADFVCHKIVLTVRNIASESSSSVVDSLRLGLTFVMDGNTKINAK